MKILVVDDIGQNLYLLEVLLKGAGYEVVTAKNGIEALEQLRAGQFDGIVSDILMPAMDGFRLIRECKKDPVLRQLPFIFYTATYTEKKDEEFGLSLGAIRYIIKPAEPEELLRQIHSAFRENARSPRDLTMQPVPDEVTFSREYTRRVGAKLEKKERALQESEEKYRLLYENSMDALLFTSPDGSVQAANPAACAMFQRTEEEIIKIGRDGVIDSTDPRFSAALEERARTGRFKGELTFLRKDGTRFPGEISSSIFTDRNGQKRSSMIIRDITERKKAEEQLKRFSEELEKQVTERTGQLNKSLHEKEILIKEVHHRVKNNMQIITSLLNLQSRSIDDPVVLRLIQESQSRIKAMSLVHERLYKSGDISSIDLKDYIQFLARELFSFYGVKSQLVRFTINAPAINVNIDTAIPLGLMVNELISNAIKYAFPDNKRGEIVIEIAKDKKNISLIVRDNGVGIPADFDWHNAKSLGIRLVNSLVEQLQGTIELDRTVGTAFTIVVKEKE